MSTLARLAKARPNISEDAFDAAFSDGKSMTLAQTMEYVLSVGEMK
jgi:hypothetical protein